MNAREKEKKKTAIRAAAKKGSFQDNEKNGGERGEPLATEERPPRSFKRGFSMVREIRDKNCGEIKTLGREASSCFFF